MRVVITVVEVKEGKANKVGALDHMKGSVSEGFLKTRPLFLSSSLTIKRGRNMERHTYVPLDDVREFFTNITRPLPDTRTFSSAIRNKKPVSGCRGFIEYLYSDRFDHATLIEHGADGQIERLYGVRKETIGISHSNAWIAKNILDFVVKENRRSRAKDGVTEEMRDDMRGHVESWVVDGPNGVNENSPEKGWENPVFNGQEETGSSPDLIDMHARKEWVGIRVLDYLFEPGKEVNPEELLKLGNSNGLFHLESVESVLRKLLVIGRGLTSFTYLGNGDYVAGYERFMTSMRSGDGHAALVLINSTGHHLYTIMFETRDDHGFGINWASWYEDVLINVPSVVNMINEGKKFSRGIASGWGRTGHPGQNSGWGSLPGESQCANTPVYNQSRDGWDTPLTGTVGHIKSMYVDEQGKVMVMSGGQWTEYKGNPMDVLMSLVAKRG